MKFFPGKVGWNSQGAVAALGCVQGQVGAPGRFQGVEWVKL